MKVAVDAMGGDSAPEVVIRGAVGYLKDNSDMSIVLVGKEKEIKKEFKKNKIDFPGNLEILNAHEKVLMREHFFSYWKKREKTSIKKALDLVKHKKAQAMISAGNTGAVMAIAKTVLGTLKRIERPALALMVPTLKGQSLLVDVGANVDSKPKNLVQFALMGKVFLESVIGIKDPRIALMSIGEEETRGNELIKTTYNILKSMDINFVGNVEGRDVYIGRFYRQRHLKSHRRCGGRDALAAKTGDHVQYCCQGRFFPGKKFLQTYQEEDGLFRVRWGAAVGSEWNCYYRSRGFQ
jgi:glycerol-3-phosphate acyltransferase PlsX